MLHYFRCCLFIFFAIKVVAQPTNEINDSSLEPKIVLSPTSRNVSSVVGQCKIALVLLGPEFHTLNISVVPVLCDPLRQENLSAILKLSKLLLSSVSLQNQSLYIRLPFDGEILIKKWSEFLGKNPEFQKKRQKSSIALNNLNNDSIGKLIVDAGILDLYKTYFEDLGYKFEKLNLEKVSFVNPNDIHCCGDFLKKKGFSAKNRIPVPLFFEVHLKPRNQN